MATVTGSETEIVMKKRRSVLRTTFTKLANKALDLLKEDCTTDELEASFSLLRDKHDKLIILNEEILNKLYEEDTEEDILEEEINVNDEYTSKFYTIKSKYDKLSVENDQNSNLGLSSNKTNSSCRLNNRPNTNVRLPKIELFKFNGDIKNWLSFWSQFKKIHDSNELSDEDKFQYLLQATEPESRARIVVSSFPPTAENYSKAVESLKSRFGREDLQIEIYVRELLNLTLSNYSEKKPILYLYDKIETQLRALDTLGVTSDKCAALLYPLIESCLSEDIIRAWQRSISSNLEIGDKPLDLKSKLDSLVRFLKSEVESEERIKIAVNGFDSCKSKRQNKDKFSSQGAGSAQFEKEMPNKTLPASAANLVNCKDSVGPNIGQQKDRLRSCIFCSGSHPSENCFKARKMTNLEKVEILKKHGQCFLCLKPSHLAKHCKAKLNCIICGKKHVPLMCTKQDETSTNEVKTENSLSASTRSEVLLQTLCVTVKGENAVQRARVLVDTGSQRSYITKKLAQAMKYEPIRKEKLRHSLFGGFQSDVEQHNCYRVRLQSLTSEYACNFEVLDQVEICKSIPTAGIGPWVKELTQLGVELTDNCSEGIDVLIGADIAGKILTDQRIVLECGLVAVGTLLGWTLLGRTPTEPTIGGIPKNCDALMCTTSMLLRDKPITQLWELDTIGIQDPIMKRSKNEETAAAQTFFEKCIMTDEDGRYKVSLLWKEGHPPLPTNINIATKRLENTVKKLKDTNMYDEYDSIFKEWEMENIIESVPMTDNFGKQGHYLPHRPVFKDGSTTKIRPVFDASAKEYNQPSLNDCLNTGVNLIEKIPSLLLGFRFHEIGVIADIKKAFLQIKLYENDRDFLKFLWINKENKIQIYRHKRVVFGVSCSPFLLGATINYHLNQLDHGTDEHKSTRPTYSQTVINELKNGFYVDNCVLSVSSRKELDLLIKEASDIFLEAKMELRGWESTDSSLPPNTQPTPVLGMFWDKRKDNLKINMTNIDRLTTIEERITKRTILSTTHKVFDVIGVSAPVTIVPKIILQQIWKLNLKWDQEIPQELKESFQKWKKELHILSEIMVPRWLSGDRNSWTLHIFNDASKCAYATVIFLRAETTEQVKLHFIAAKSRVAPVKSLTIPRLELLAACIGARLASSIIGKLNLTENSVFYWSDSSTVLSWIQRDDCWTTFVWNRTKEIRELSSKDSWRFIPGSLNPADLASRGCSAKELYKLRWWEGPEWLKKPMEKWPKNEFTCSEKDVVEEKRKGIVTTLLTTQNYENNWYYSYFSKFEKIVRLVGWMIRFKTNCLDKSKKQSGPLTVTELSYAELLVIKMIQQDSFLGVEDKALENVCPFLDDIGIIRIKTKITQRNDSESFRVPIVLPSKHPVVRLLIHEQHIKSCHAGIQSLLSILRERFWILNGRKTIRTVLRKCVTCLRQTSKGFEAKPTSLPNDRVKEAAVFEVCGIDFAGPLLMKNKEKAWICLFTCAVYRAVHLELVTSLSTNDFIQALRRFISRRGRPSICYSDNGTNFVGTSNALSQIDWNRISEFSSVQRILWKFNPPSSPWWGGWWERLVGLMKQLLRKVLGKAYLKYEELYTVLCDCEAVLNSRPLTYMSENPDDLIPLTPAMFLTDIKQNEVPDLDQIEETNLNKRLCYRQKLKNDLRRRFRIEYLGMLTTRSKKSCRPLKKGEVVIVQNEDKRRLQWPLAVVEEVIPGKDREIRLAKLRTQSGTILRPVKKIHSLEIENPEEIEKMKKVHSLETKTPEEIEETTEKCVKQSKYNLRKKNIEHKKWLRQSFKPQGGRMLNYNNQ